MTEEEANRAVMRQRDVVARRRAELAEAEKRLAELLRAAGRRPGDGSDQPALFQREAQGNLF